MGILVEIFWRVTFNIVVVGRCFLFIFKACLKNKIRQKKSSDDSFLKWCDFAV